MSLSQPEGEALHASSRILAGIAAVLQLSCAGNVTTRVLTPASLNSGTPFEGVVFYPPQYIKLTFAYSALLNDKGEVLGTAEKQTCMAVVQKEEVTLMPDLERPMLMSNSSGLFSAAKFNVTLDKGMLTSINAEPTQKLSDVLTALPGVIPGLSGAKSEAAVTKAGPTAACNSSPVLMKLSRQSMNK